MINIELTPEKNGILAGEANTFEVLLRASSELQQPSLVDTNPTQSLPARATVYLWTVGYF